MHQSQVPPHHTHSWEHLKRQAHRSPSRTSIRLSVTHVCCVLVGPSLEDQFDVAPLGRLHCLVTQLIQLGDLHEGGGGVGASGGGGGEGGISSNCRVEAHQSTAVYA